MVDDLEALVEGAIDAVIRGFNPDDPQSFDTWEAELRRCEEELANAEVAENHLLFATVRAKRVDIAFVSGKCELVLELSGQFVRTYPATVPSYSLVASMRVRALHQVGAHRDEIEETLQVVRDPVIRGGEFISLLEGLSKRHPGSLAEEPLLADKMQEAIEGLREMGYAIQQNGSEAELSFEAMVQEVANTLRSLNRRRGEALLAGEEI